MEIMKGRFASPLFSVAAALRERGAAVVGEPGAWGRTGFS
jgi:hypothetical protein